jgi:hypothetical protein
MAAVRSVHLLFIRKFPRKVKKARDNLGGTRSEPQANSTVRHPCLFCIIEKRIVRREAKSFCVMRRFDPSLYILRKD